MDSIAKHPSSETKVGFYMYAKDTVGISQGISVRNIISKIKGFEYASTTGELRTLVGDEFDDYKRTRFPGVSWSGRFHPTRSKGTLVEHSGLICLDFDHLSEGELDEAQSQINSDPYTFISFVSPSGKGIKVVVRLAIKVPSEHEPFFEQLRTYYQDTYGLEADTSCRDVSRLCFLPHDPDMFLNGESQLFILDDTQIKAPPTSIPLDVKQYASVSQGDDQEVFHWCLRVHDRTHTIMEGQRNHYLTALANFCNDYGVSREYCEAECLLRFTEPGFTEGEIRATIRSVYRKTANHGIKVYQRQSRPEKEVYLHLTPEGHDGESVDDDSPTIPSQVYGELPDLLRRMCAVFGTDRERDTFLTSALIVMSGTFPEVKGLYDGVYIRPNLFGFIVAPPASGKGAMGWARHMAMGVHRRLMEAGGPTGQKGAGLQGEESGGGAFPSMLFLPANSSGASIISFLDSNDGIGIIFESEADTMSATVSQDWGNYSDMLRKSFHHETISYMRKTNAECISIDRPRLSVCLSGTPAQVQRLIPNAEDGLFSRFVFYSFCQQPKWRSVSPFSGRVNLEERFDEFQAEFTGLVEAVRSAGPVRFAMQKRHWDELDGTFSGWLDRVVGTVGGDASSAVKRLGTITFRIAMILSVLRWAETGEALEEIVCTDTDFRIAMALAETYLHHSLAMYVKMPQEKKAGAVVHRISEKEAKLQEAKLLKESAMSYREIGRKLGVADGTVRNWLKEGA